MGLTEITNAFERIGAARLPGVKNVAISGYNGGVTTNAETIWDQSTAYSFRTAAMSTPYIASSDANDTSAGTGARTVLATLITTDFAEVEETLTLNGQTSVNLVTANVLSVQKLEVITAGSGGANAGVIRIGTGVNTAGVPAVIDANIPIGANVSRHGFYVVPANKILMIKALRVGSGSATAGAISGVIRQAVGLAGLVKEPYVFMGSNNDATNLDLQMPLVFTSQSKLNFMLIASAGTGPASLLANGVQIDIADLTPPYQRWI